MEVNSASYVAAMTEEAAQAAQVELVGGVGRIDFFFDPMCPWAYQTSLWMREIRRLTGLAID